LFCRGAFVTAHRKRASFQAKEGAAGFPAARLFDVLGLFLPYLMKSISW